MTTAYRSTELAAFYFHWTETIGHGPAEAGFIPMTSSPDGVTVIVPTTTVGKDVTSAAYNRSY